MVCNRKAGLDDNVPTFLPRAMDRYKEMVNDLSRPRQPEVYRVGNPLKRLLGTK